ncbi:hypothetical protein H0H93_012021 [Arthromyces matolae]|nr:hypothetical protein H0H93_012021 [Arthromyces matolae]
MSNLNTLVACQAFVNTQSPQAIVSQLRRDQRIAQDSTGGLPSLLVYCLPPASSAEGRRIAQALSSDQDNPDGSQIRISTAVSRMRLAGIVQTIKAYMADMKRNGPDTNTSLPPQLVPSDDDLNAALKVLRYLQLPFPFNLGDPTPLKDIVTLIEEQISLGPAVRESLLHNQSSHVSPDNPIPIKASSRNKKCYICLFNVTSSHPLYPALCVPCGNFNTTSSVLSLPPQFNLTTKTALVTGGRINLGYHVALRLLRAGCSVLVSTRYPHDAEVRYKTEPDSQEWNERLRIIGADFRTAKDVFALLGVVKNCLRDWHRDKLDILINNAAQTLTDHVDVEKHNLEREVHLKSVGTGSMVVDGGYFPRVRGDMITIGAPNRMSIEPQTDMVETERRDESQILTKSVKSSWTQRLAEIPYEDVIATHSINTFVPLILMRELIPIMSACSPHSVPIEDGSSQPAGYIVNVSSREGIPESRPSHPAKAGHHVHTNMSKAALNMLTETQSGEAWQKSRIAVNSVDPGYMSADPEWMKLVDRKDEACPIGWEDGAARVLWPVAVGETGNPVWGRFLKHFQAIDVNRLA